MIITTITSNLSYSLSWHNLGSFRYVGSFYFFKTLTFIHNSFAVVIVPFMLLCCVLRLLQKYVAVDKIKYPVYFYSHGSSHWGSTKRKILLYVYVSTSAM